MYVQLLSAFGQELFEVAVAREANIRVLPARVPEPFSPAGYDFVFQHEISEVSSWPSVAWKSQ